MHQLTLVYKNSVCQHSYDTTDCFSWSGVGREVAWKSQMSWPTVKEGDSQPVLPCISPSPWSQRGATLHRVLDRQDPPSSPGGGTEQELRGGWEATEEPQKEHCLTECFFLNIFVGRFRTDTGMRYMCLSRVSSALCAEILAYMSRSNWIFFLK